MTATTATDLRALIARTIRTFEFEEDKHPRDERGRFAESEGGDLPEGWRTEEPGAFVAAYRTGMTLVNVSEKANEKVPIEAQHAVLAKLGALQEEHPLGYRLTVNILSPGEMRSKGASGETFTRDTGVSVIELNAGVMDPDGYQPRGDSVGKKIPDVPYNDYLVTHEYGHALMNADDVTRDFDVKHGLDRIDMMKSEEPPSAYGNIRTTNEWEAYAEAFSDWKLNPSPGPLAKALAEHEGWA